ncbi:MAG: acetyl-CoA carboxylase biotin carboxyl carrier protein [Pseudomonadota bacterium]|jgi:acetyl-CoA carboxylase biotin carboxyl carrier protein
MSLSHEDVVRIIQILDASHFDELSLEAEGVKLNIRRNGAGETTAQVSEKPVLPVAAPSVVKASTAGEAGLIDIRAPMLGVFYGAPKPGAAPFVSEGSQVDKDTVIGIIEVMKLMNSVSARVQGIVVETLVNDGEMVEYDQVLARVRPA